MSNPLSKRPTGQVSGWNNSSSSYTALAQTSFNLPYGLQLRQTITSSGAVTIPAGIPFVYVIMTGGGGGSNTTGTGGGGGGVSWGWTLANSICIVGAGGAAITIGGYTRYGHIIAGGGGYAGLAENYAAMITAGLPGTANAVPNIQYVNDAIAAATSSEGAIQSVTAVVPLNANGTVNIGNALPAVATILSVKVKVTVADTGAILTIGDTVNGASSYMGGTENDPQAIGMYVSECYVAGAGSQQVFATVGSTGGTTSSSCIVVVTYAS